MIYRASGPYYLEFMLLKGGSLSDLIYLEGWVVSYKAILHSLALEAFYLFYNL